MSVSSMFRGDVEPWQPLVAVALCFVIGVWIGWQLSVRLLWLIGGLMTLVALYYWRGWRWLALLGVVLSGVIVASFSHESFERLPDEGLYALRVSSPRHVMVEAVMDEDGVWRAFSQPLLYGCDTTLEFRSGDRLIYDGRVRRFEGRGYIYIAQRGVIEHESDARLGARVNVALGQQIVRLGLNDESISMVQAMLLGDRDDIDREIITSYRRSGAAHILAVSGLHVGIVALVLLSLLQPLMMIYQGHIARSVLVVILVWFYAYVVGMSPSVVRATIMYTALVAAPIFMREYNSLNILSFCVLIITLFDPSSIFDVGFQLSIVAVASILLWALPLWSLRRGFLRSWWSEALLLPLLIGVVCTLSTLPIISHTFGYVSLCGVLLNPLILTTAYFILVLSMVWLVVVSLFGLFTPLVTLLSPLFCFAIELCVMVQNGVVEWASSGWRDAVDMQMGGFSVALIYVAYLLLTVALTNYIKERSDSIGKRIIVN